MYGQEPEIDLTVGVPHPYTPSSQTWGFVKYGNTPVDLHTGTARVDIPVYTYRDEDFTIPISLAYASNGFIPNQQTGPLGLNWSLIAGGVVAREIRGLDDFYGNEQGVLGFLRWDSRTIDDEELMEKSTDNIAGLVNWGDPTGRVETQSDIYHFSFAGHSGTFHYNGKKECVVYNTGGNNGAYKITYSEPNDMGLSFTIVTPDGYRYIFGSDEKSDSSEQYFERIIKGSIQPNSDLAFTTETSFRNPIVSWYLHSIVAPNGRMVKFTYTNYQIAHNPNNMVGSDNGDHNYIVTFRKQQRMDTKSGDKIYKTPSVLKTTYLSEIDIDGKVFVEFTYSMKDSKEAGLNNRTDRPHIRYMDLIQRLMVLDRIRVYSRRNTLSDCSLTYHTVDLRPLLESVSVFGQGTYRMEYYLDHPLPDLLSNNYDFWDYANGREMSDDSAFTGTGIDNLDEYVAPGSQKLPDAGWSVLGNLKKITYPAGGSSAFEYEAHRAKYALLKRLTSQGRVAAYDSLTGSEIEIPTITVIESPFMAYLYGIEKLRAGTDAVGGIRIRKITDDNGTGRITTRKYDYIDPTGASSGNLLRFPRYIAFNRYDYFKNPYHVYIGFLATARTSFDKSHIEYARVVEKRSDGTATEYNYSNYRDTPDDYSDQHKKITDEMSLEEDHATVVDNIYREPNSRHNRRGKLRLKIAYDRSGLPLTREEFIYGDHNDGDTSNYSAYAVNSGRQNWSAKLYTGDYRLIRKDVTSYNPAGTIRQEKLFTYTPSGRIRGTYTKLKDGTVLADSLVYASERMISHAQQKLVERNMDKPVEIFRILTDGKTDTLRRQLYDYTLTDNGLPVLFQGIERTRTATGFKDRILFQNTRYNHLGRLLETTDMSGITTSYIWGHDGLFPVAKIENGMFDNLAANLSDVPGLEDLTVPLHENLTDEQESALRSRTDGLVTTFRHIPFVGVTLVTDPIGRKTYYEYDSLNRLTRIKNTLNEMVKTYEYSVTR